MGLSFKNTTLNVITKQDAKSKMTKTRWQEMYTQTYLFVFELLQLEFVFIADSYHAFIIGYSDTLSGNKQIITKKSKTVNLIKWLWSRCITV